MGIDISPLIAILVILFLKYFLVETVPKKLVTFKKQWTNLLPFDRPKTAGKEYKYPVIPAEAGIQ